MSRRKKVLVIDDERSIVTYLTAVLEDEGYRPLSASDAEEGAEVARAEEPDLICMDIMMPKRSGIALYEELKRDARLADTPVIFISAFTMVRDLRDLQAFRKMIPDEAIPQPEASLEKPIAVGDFLGEVRRLIGEPSRGQKKGGR